jgi:hypothetical protein
MRKKIIIYFYRANFGFWGVFLRIRYLLWLLVCRWFWGCGGLFFVFLRAGFFVGHFEGYFWGAETFLALWVVPRCARDNLGVGEVEAPSGYPEGWPVEWFARERGMITRVFGVSGTLMVMLCPIATKGQIQNPSPWMRDKVDSQLRWSLRQK